MGLKWKSDGPLRTNFVDLSNVILAEPKTYTFRDYGKLVMKFISHHKIEPEDMIVIHHTQKLPVGKWEYVSFGENPERIFDAQSSDVPLAVFSLERFMPFGKSFSKLSIGIGAPEMLNYSFLAGIGGIRSQFSNKTEGLSEGTIFGAYLRNRFNQEQREIMDNTMIEVSDFLRDQMLK